MQINTTFKNLPTSTELSEYIEERFARLDRLLEGSGKADVVLRAENRSKVVDIHLVDSPLEIYVSESNEDLRAAIDLVIDKVKLQITRLKERGISKRARKRPETPWPDVA